MQKTGIETVKKALAVSLGIAKGVHDALADDGKIKFFEALGIVGKAFDFADVINRRQQLIAEVRDLDPEERAALARWVRDTYQVPDERVETTVESSINLFFDILDFSLTMANVWAKP